MVKLYGSLSPLAACLTFFFAVFYYSNHVYFHPCYLYTVRFSDIAEVILKCTDSLL